MRFHSRKRRRGAFWSACGWILCVCALSFSAAAAQAGSLHTQVDLPEGAVARFGKGSMHSAHYILAAPVWRFSGARASGFMTPRPARSTGFPPAWGTPTTIFFRRTANGSPPCRRRGILTLESGARRQERRLTRRGKSMCARRRFPRTAERSRSGAGRRRWFGISRKERYGGSWRGV